MRILVLGCGGIGGVLAATLTRAGHDVTPVTGNAAIAEAIAARGLRVVELDGKSWSVPARRPPLVTLEGTPAGEPFDVCLAVTQSPALADSLRSVLPHLGERCAVVTCQNGLPEEHAAQVVGPERVVGCVVGWGASMIEPGVYRRTSAGGLQLGRGAGTTVDPEPVARLLEAASPARVVPDLAGVRWSKLAINCATSTLGAISGWPLGELLRHRFARRLALEVFAELVAVARASGVTLAPVGGTFHIDKIAIAPEERKLAVGSLSLAYKHALLFAVGMKYRRMRSSMLYAIERGRPPEIDFLNGELVRRGAALGVPTPVNAACVEAVHAIVAGRARSSPEHLRELARRLESVTTQALAA